METVIEFDELTHAYNKAVPVLEGVSLTINKGEFVGLIGLSGAGKSTLLRCVNGLITYTGGNCKVFGTEVRTLNEAKRRLMRRQIGMIFQEFNLQDRLSVLKNALVGRLGYTDTLRSVFHDFSKNDLELALGSLERVGLQGYERRRVRSLSGGQKQRVAIARAITQQASIILADEATANLDVYTKEDIMALIRDLVVNDQVTVLASMHDLPLAKRYCTRIVGLQNGRITFDAHPDTLDDDAVAEVLGRKLS